MIIKIIKQEKKFDFQFYWMRKKVEGKNLNGSNVRLYIDKKMFQISAAVLVHQWVIISIIYHSRLEFLIKFKIFCFARHFFL